MIPTMQGGFMTSPDLDQLRTRLYSLYDQLRPDALSIVDAFEMHDRYLNSAIGSYDGRAYENLFTWASRSALNVNEVSFF